MAGVYQIPNKEEKINELVKMFKLEEVLNQKAKTPEGKESKEATSEEKAEEETQAEDDKNKEIAVTSITCFL